MNKKRRYYALGDTFCGPFPWRSEAGFANCKIAVRFDSRKERDEYLAKTKLVLARALTLKEVRRLKLGVNTIESCVDETVDGDFIESFFSEVGY